MRLIDADKLLEKKKMHLYYHLRNGDIAIPIIDIEHAQTVELKRKTGMWRHYEGFLTCSECNAKFYDDIMEYCGDQVPKFCPDCGADMTLMQQ